MSVDGIVSGVFAADLPVTGGQIFLPPSRSEWRRCMPELPSEKDGAEKRRKRSTVRRNSVLFTGVFKAHIELHVRKKTSRSRRKIDKPVQICYKVGGLLLENLKNRCSRQSKRGKYMISVVILRTTVQKHCFRQSTQSFARQQKPRWKSW